MNANSFSTPSQNSEHHYQLSNAIIGFEKASRLLMVGGGCLIIVLIFGIILCRLDMSAGKKRRGPNYNQVEH